MTAPLRRPRYVVAKELGRGGMGHVELAYDRIRGELVARKRASRTDVVSLLRFKDEFRVIVGLTHPHLVRLFELDQDEEGVFFTMEYVEGSDLLAHSRRGDGAIAAAASPLVDALAFLHAHGVVHGDVKPSNVLVRTDGHVKLVDFGVLARVGRESDSSVPAVGGTPAYLAPEIRADARPSPASDLYALGQTLFVCYGGDAQRSEPGPAGPVPLRTVRPDVAPSIAELIDALRCADPSKRPDLAAVSEAFGGSVLSRRPRVRASVSPLVGREEDASALLDRIDAAFEGAGGALVVEGVSGVGKSSLVAEVTRTAERAGAIVLRGGAHLCERTAFNGVDDVVDALAKLLLRRRVVTAPVMSACARAAALFPVLAFDASVDVSSSGSPIDVAPAARAPGDRDAALGALVELLELLAAERGALVVVVDDVQWADADAAALLATIAARRPPRVLVLATQRTDVPEGPAPRLLVAAGVERRTLAPLDERQIGAIIAGVFTESRRSAPAPEALATIAAASGGLPLLAEMAARAMLDGGAPTDAPLDALTLRVSSLKGLARRIFAVLFVAGGWLDATLLGSAVETSLGLLDEALLALAQRGLVRVSGTAPEVRQGRLYHDAVRASGAATLRADEVQRAHGRLYDVLSRRGGTPDERLVDHLVGAGRDDEARRLAATAGRAALARGAYALATDLLEVALIDAADDRSGLLAAYARALELTGRYADEAAVHAERAALVAPDEAADARADEARALLAAGEVVRGRARLRAAMGAAGARLDGRLAKVLAGARFMLGPRRLPVLRTRGAARDASRDERLAAMVAFFDPVAGLGYLQRAQAGFLARGDLVSAAGCDYVFAYLALFGARASGPVRLARAYRESAQRRLAGAGTVPPRVASMEPFLDGVELQRLARWRPSCAAFEAANAVLESSGQRGTFEHRLIRTHVTATAILRGDAHELAREMELLRSSGAGRADSPSRAYLEVHSMRLATMLGDFEGAAERARALLESWPRERTQVRTYVEVSTAFIGAYVGDAAAEWLRVSEAIRRDGRPLRMMYAARHAASIALLAARAIRARVPGVGLRDVRRLVHIALRAPPFNAASTLRALAYAEEAEGAPRSHVLARLASAERLAVAGDQPLEAAIAADQRGRRLEGAAGRAERDRAHEELARLGVSSRITDECEP